MLCAEFAQCAKGLVDAVEGGLQGGELLVVERGEGGERVGDAQEG